MLKRLFGLTPSKARTAPGGAGGLWFRLATDYQGRRQVLEHSTPFTDRFSES